MSENYMESQFLDLKKKYQNFSYENLDRKTDWIDKKIDDNKDITETKFLFV